MISEKKVLQLRKKFTGKFEITEGELVFTSRSSCSYILTSGGANKYRTLSRMKSGLMKDMGLYVRV